jgi:LacI family repressor for deo operon, udp, cdd, tsx, nupC, and nupG
VINGHERVTDETRQRVETAIAELGYQPNAIARSMARGRTYTLACISPNLTDFTFASFIEGAESEARQQGYFLLTASAPNAETFATLVNQLLASRRTEGLLVITPNVEPHHLRIPKYVSAVFIGANPKQDWIASVTLDEEKAGGIATEHLIRLGHTQIAHITGPLVEDSSQNRLSGYQTAIAAAGLSTGSQMVFEGDWSATSGYQAVQYFLDSNTRFSAIFAQNDRMAVGAIRALRDAGKHIPQDISVIGIDDMPLASYFDPPLTTILQDTFQMGREAACQLISSIEKPENPCQQIRIEPRLIIRHSTTQYGQ